MRIWLTLLISLNGVVLLGQSEPPEQCDCVYPILFIHGWNGTGNSWENSYDNEYFKRTWGSLDNDYSIRLNRTVEGTAINYWSTEIDENNSSHVYNAVLNASQSTLADDDIIVHEEFVNAPALTKSCLYAINFDNSWNGDSENPELVHSSDRRHIYEVNTHKYPDDYSDESDSNQSSAYKQGIALGKAIKKILEITEKDKIILVAHSMGGLASREYLQRSYDGGDTHPNWIDSNTMTGHRVHKLITFGTPHRGSNSGNSLNKWATSISALFSDMDLRSEAVRDLRYSYEQESLSSKGVYLYGGIESNILTDNSDDYYNHDVNCNGTENDEIIGLNNTGSVPWEGTMDNENMPLPPDLKYCYYVSDGFEINRPDKYASTLPDEESDIIVRANRQWLYKNLTQSANGNSIDFENRLSIPVPFISIDERITPYVLSDRVSSTQLTDHLSQPSDINKLNISLDEGDFPFFAGKIQLDHWYFGLVQQRADIVPENSFFSTASVSPSDYNKIDSDWFYFELDNERDVRIKFQNQIANQICTVQLFSEDQISSEYSNATEGSIAAMEIENTDLNFIQPQGSLTPGKYYMSVTYDLRFQGVDLAKIWENPYKYKIETGEPGAYWDNSCLGIELTAYGNCNINDFGGFIRQIRSCDFYSSYNPEYGQLTIPLNIYSTSVNYPRSEIETIINEINNKLTFQSVPFELSIKSYSNFIPTFNGSTTSCSSNSSFYFQSLIENDLDISFTNSKGCDLFLIDNSEEFHNKSKEDAAAINVFLVDDIVRTSKTEDGDKYFSFNGLGTFPSSVGNSGNSIWVENEEIENINTDLLIHEIGHNLGLLHTFHDVFDGDRESACGDLISDTPYDPNSDRNDPDNPPLNNYMDYEDHLTFSSEVLNEFTICQQAKMLDILFSCHDYCTEPNKPQINIGGYLSPDTLDTYIGYPLPVLLSELDQESKTNTGNYGLFTIKDINGSILHEAYNNRIDLENIQSSILNASYESLLVELRDSSIHSSSCVSVPDTMVINIVLCNDNGICDEEELNVDCDDCTQSIPDNISPLNRLEYFFNADPGYGQGTPLEIISEVAFSKSYTLPMAGLNSGINTLFIRAENKAGNWSFVERRTFYVLDGSSTSSDLDYLEYFIDTDPGVNNAEPLGVSGPEESDAFYSIDLSGIDPGIHTIYVRAKNKLGQWSFVQRRIFYVMDGSSTSSDLDYLEYFIDMDPGINNAEPLGISGPEESDAFYSIDLSGIDPGIHTVYVRAKNELGQWSFVQRRTFYVTQGDITGEPEIVEIEYFIDSDPGIGNAQKISFSPGDSVDVDISLDATHYRGNNIIYVRAKDNYGRWSFLVNDTLNWSGNFINLFDRAEESLEHGMTIEDIEWDTVNNVGLVNIDLINPSGEFVRRIAMNIDPGGSLSSWIIPANVPTGSYRIKIYDQAEPSIFDISENVIHITAICQDILNIDGSTNDIIGIYSASQKIISNGLISKNETTFSAPNIELDQGFEVPLGALFEALIEGCSNN